MRRHGGYAMMTVALLAIEIVIALFVRDAIVRPYIGDALAVVLVYTGLRAVTRASVGTATIAAFAIATAIEIGQYCHILATLGLADSTLARTILGSGFDPKDFLAYGGGALVVLAVERYRRASRASPGTRTRNPSSESSSTI